MILLNPPREQQLPMPTAPVRPEVRSDPHLWPHLALLTGVIIFGYFGMWRAYFATLDDFGITGWVRHQATWWDAVQGYGSGVRFLNYLPLRLKTEFFGLDAALYLWASLLQYLLLTWLVYRLAFLLLRGPRGALLAALLFAVHYSHYEVVTYVSASDYTLWGSVYLGVLILFATYLDNPQPIHYWGAITLALLLAFAHDFTLSLALVVTAYYLTIGLGQRRLWSLGWRDVRLLLPFWLIWAIHVGLQLYLVMAGTSEAVYSENGYAPGLHMLSNLRYLIFLAIPNMTIDPIQNFLTAQLPSVLVELLWAYAMGLGVLIHGVLLWLFWRGNQATRFAVALIYLPFLQYTPWHGHFIEAPRYLLLPSVGYSLLVVNLLFIVIRWIRQQRAFRYALALMVALFFYGIGNILVVQVWVERHVENGEFRRAFVTALTTEYPQLTREDRVWIEVPKAKFLDLAAACRLVYPEYVPCQTFVTGEAPTQQMIDLDGGTFYRLRATDTGIEQVEPMRNR